MQNFLFGKKGYTSTNVAARGMIISAYDILKKEMQDEDVFSTANAWKMTKQAQPQPPALLVNRYESAQRVLEDKSSAISGRSLLETIHFLEDADSAPTTVGNIIKAYISQPDQYFQLEKDIKKALDDLVEARILILNDNQYRITSDIEQRLLDEMNEFAVQSFVRKGFLVEYYKKSSFIKSAGSIVDNGIKYDVYVTTDLDDELTSPARKNLKLKVKSIYSISDDRNADVTEIKNTYQNQQDLIYLIPDNSQFSEIDKLITEIKRIEFIVDKYQRNDIEEVPYIRSFASIKETKEDALKTLIEKSFVKAAEQNIPGWEAHAYLALGLTMLMKEQFDVAKAYIEKASLIYSRINQKWGIINSQEALILMDKKNGINIQKQVVADCKVVAIKMNYQYNIRIAEQIENGEEPYLQLFFL